jgi:TolB protein
MERPPAHEIHYLVAGEQQRHLITSSSSSNPYPIYSPTGHILYVDGQGESTGIWALPFSLATLKATGRAFPVASGSSPKLSLAGTLVYSDVPSDLLQLVWNDRSGKALSTVGAPQLYRFPSLSPDGQRLVVSVREGGPDLWTVDVARSILTRFTFDSASPRLAAWSPSGSEITYARFHESSFDLYSQPASGGQPRVLVSTPAEEWAAAWSPDGRYLVYESSSRETLRDILLRERRTDGSLGDAAVFLRTRFDEGAPAFSPDGTHIAYVSNESGQNEVYVRQFPTGEGPWRVSTNGGLAPRWAGKAKELFYVEGHQLMAVSVATAPRFVPGKPVPLFAKRTLRNFNPQYDVTADGRRFILPERIVEERPLAIHVVHNWFEEFRGDR